MRNITILIYYPVFFVFAILTSCVQTDEIITTRVKEVGCMDIFPDSSFFSDLRGLTCDDNCIYMLDVNRRNVVGVSMDFSKMFEYGVGGRGPGELQAPYSFVVNHKKVSIIDFMTKTIKHYDSRGYIGEDVLTFPPRDNRFCVIDDSYLIPVRSEANQFVCWQNDSICFAGHTIEIGSPLRTLTMNASDILTYEDKIIVVPKAFPYIYIYNNNFVLLNKVDLSIVKFYSDNLSYVSANSVDNDDKSYYNLNIDAYCSGNLLYLLCPRYGKTYKSDRVLEIDLTSGHVTSVLALPDGCYRSICVNDDKLYAFNSTRCSLDVIALHVI